MGQNKNTIFLAIFSAVLFSALFFLLSAVSAQECEGGASATICIPTAASTGLPAPVGGVPGIVKNVLNWMLGLVGIIAIIGFVISGFQYITASGSEKIVETAKRNMTYSVIGVIVALSGFVIIQAIDAALRGNSTIF